MIEATIEDLAFTIRSSRETIWERSQIVSEDVLSTILLKNKRSGQAREQRLEWKRLGVNARSSTAAEKDGEGMVLKIFTGEKPFLKAHIKPFGITEMKMPPGDYQELEDLYRSCSVKKRLKWMRKILQKCFLPVYTNVLSIHKETYDPAHR